MWLRFTRIALFFCLGGLLFPASTAALTIMEIQGHGHTSPYANQAVVTSGIATTVTANGFYLQDPAGDGDIATSEGIFIYTVTPPTVSVGYQVQVTGTVQEYLPGGNSDNLTSTEIIGPSIVVLSTGNPLPAATIIGAGGRVPPVATIEDDAYTTFDPQTDGADFYESLEGMIVVLHGPRVVGSTNSFGEIFVVVDGATGVNSRGGITISEFDYNPERIQIDDTVYGSAPDVQVGDLLTDVQGPVTYNFGNYEVTPTVAPAVATPANNSRETTALTGDQAHLTIATFNVENLDPGDGARFNDIAAIIANNLRAPDIIGVQEIQDNNGPTNNGVVDASTTFQTLINAIQVAGGPAYNYRSISPVNNQDGGEPGGNIRVGFLYNASRVAFIDRGVPGPTTPTQVVNGGAGPELTVSPGRIDPLNPAFTTSRKPLAGEFEFIGEKLFVVVNHFTSKTGSDPLFGSVQPPADGGGAKRVQQAQVVNNFVDNILALNPGANVVVLGDLNDFSFSPALKTLVGIPPVLTDPAAALPSAEYYSYVFEGNSQALDHILVTPSLLAEVDIVHLDAEFTTKVSDHDPTVVCLLVADPTPVMKSFVHTDLRVHPNPFNPSATITYSLASMGQVTLRIYDPSGRLVATLVDGVKDAGSYAANWNGRDGNGIEAASGVYFVRLQTGGEALTRKAVLLK